RRDVEQAIGPKGHAAESAEAVFQVGCKHLDHFARSLVDSSDAAVAVAGVEKVSESALMSDHRKHDRHREVAEEKPATLRMDCTQVFHRHGPHYCAVRAEERVAGRELSKVYRVLMCDANYQHSSEARVGAGG